MLTYPWGVFGETSLIGLPKTAEITTAFVGIWNLVATATHSGLQSALMGLLNTKDHSMYFQHSGPTGTACSSALERGGHATSDPTDHGLWHYPEGAF